MGCHTWFKRPLTEDEFRLMKEYAPTEIYELVGKGNTYLYDKSLYEMLMKSYNEDINCVYGKKWCQLGYGSGNPEFIETHGSSLSVSEIDGRLYVDMSFSSDICQNKYGVSIWKFYETHEKLGVDFPYFHDVFRIRNYPRKVIHNRRELRKYLRKRYFELSEYQLDRISKFFELYPGGVITFG